MRTTALHRATQTILGREDSTDANTAQWFEVLNFLKYMMPALIKCIPDAIKAHDYWTKEFQWWERWIGRERARDSLLNKAFADFWRGPSERMPQIREALRWSLKNGKITADMFIAAYREWSANRGMEAV